MYILVLESSTTSAKALLYDADKGTYQVHARAYRQGEADRGLGDAEAVFQETAGLGRALAAGKDVAAIALSCTWHSLMLCGRDMKPATPVFLWSNTEASALCGELRVDGEYTRAYYQKTGCMVNAIYPFFKLKMLAGWGYDLSAHRVLGQGSYNTFRLTGEWAVTDAVASGSGLLDIRAKDYDPALLDELGISRAQLGRLVSFRDTLPLCVEGAALLGLAPGIPVIAAMPDGALNQVGSEAMGDGVMTLSLGTSGAMRLCVSRPLLPETPGTWCYLGPDTWLSGAATSGCCNCVDWCKSLFAGADYARLEAEAEAEAAGRAAQAASAKDRGPVFLPFLFGERCPGWDDGRGGGFLDLKPSHTRGDMYRAVLEGVLFNLYQCYEILCGVNGTPGRIKLSGGISHSPFWRQMCADIFGHEMEPDAAVHASLAGGLKLARHVLGLAGSLTEEAGEAGGVRISPDREKAGIYGEKYARYLAAYSANMTKRG